MKLNKEKWPMIEGFGKSLGVSASALQKWKTRGVPHKFRLVMMDMAEDRGEVLKSTDFDLVSK